jgi:virginiamycin A acetyltransferase
MGTIVHQLTQEDIHNLNSSRIYFSQEIGNRLCPGQNIYYDDQCVCESYSAILAGDTIPSMGSYSYSWSNLPIGLVVGRYCSISWGLSIIANNHPIDFVSSSSFSYDTNFVIFREALRDRSVSEFVRHPARESRPGRGDLPKIGNDVWIGMNVTLGTGCVIAASSVVTKSVLPYAIVAGNPARVVRFRFPEETIKKLLTSDWWKYSFVDFAHMRYDEPEIFLTQLSARIQAGSILELPTAGPSLHSLLANGSS